MEVRLYCEYEWNGC